MMFAMVLTPQLLLKLYYYLFLSLHSPSTHHLFLPTDIEMLHHGIYIVL